MSGVISPSGYGYSQGFNPGEAIGWMGGLQNLAVSRYQLQQAQNQPMLAGVTSLLGKQNPTWDDIFENIGESARMGGNPSPMTQALNEYMASPGATPRGFIEQQTTRYVPSFEGAQLAVGHGVSPEQYYRQIPVGMNAQGQVVTAPWGSFMLPGQNQLSDSGIGVAGNPLTTPSSGGFMPVTQALAAPESHTQNVAGPYTGRGGYASGYLQIADNTWREHAAGVPGASQYARAMDAPPNVQEAVADTIPLGEWATLPQVRQQFPWVRPNMTLGEANRIAVSQQGGGTSAGDSSAVPAPASTPTPPPQGPTLPPGFTPLTTPGGGMISQPPGLTAEIPRGTAAYGQAQQLAATLGNRIAPLENALSTLRANPNMQTGPGQSEINDLKVVGNNIAQSLGLPQLSLTDTNAFQETAKYLAQYMRGMPGANRSDLAQLEAAAASPHMEQARPAMQVLLAKAVGYERLQSAPYDFFNSQYPNMTAAVSASGSYNIQTAHWMGQQDPVAFAVDEMTRQEYGDYVRGLSPQARDRFNRSRAEALKLYPNLTLGQQ